MRYLVTVSDSGATPPLDAESSERSKAREAFWRLRGIYDARADVFVLDDVALAAARLGYPGILWTVVGEVE